MLGRHFLMEYGRRPFRRSEAPQCRVKGSFSFLVSTAFRSHAKELASASLP
jgi:hypothetical protein